MTSYLLGHANVEQDRLRFQDSVWEDETEAFIDRLELREGARVLEVGSGIGLGLPRLAARVGPTGEVIALERNAVYAKASRDLVERERLRNVRVVDRDVLRDELPEGPFDAIYSRWVFSFIPDVDTALLRLRPLLAPDGLIGVLDYNHDGVRVFPEAPAFDRVIEAVRAWYKRAGGDLWVAGRLPAALHQAGYHCEGLWPEQKAGPPGSPVYRWVEQFVKGHGPQLVAAGLLNEPTWKRFLDEWDGQRLDPAAVLFSPIVVGVIGRSPL